MATFEYVKVGDGVTQWSALPYVAGFPGATGPQGAQGNQGTPGSSGGLTFQLDFAPSATYASTPLVGNLLTSFDASTQTTLAPIPSISDPCHAVRIANLQTATKITKLRERAPRLFSFDLPRVRLFSFDLAAHTIA